jgi:uridine phosphorylase
VGARIELVSVGDDSAGLRVGDCGVVREIVESGHVVVSWDRGFAAEIDPDVNKYRRLAA